MEVVRTIGDYEIGEKLGEGGFSTVRLGIKDGQQVALKILNTRKSGVRPEDLKQVKSEIEAMSRVDHVNVLKLIDYDFAAKYPKSDGTVEDCVLVVLELAPGGELFDFLAHTGAFDEGIARAVSKQLIDGLAYCHSQKVVHRDLKPENLLLDSKFRIKIADFGFASSKDFKVMYTRCGTKSYMGPEMFASQGYDPTLTDVWATGVILFIMVAGFPPFSEAVSADWWFHRLEIGRHDLFWKAHSRTKHFSDEFKDLINKILCPDPSRRIGLHDISQHAWFEGPCVSPENLHLILTDLKSKVDSAKMRQEMEQAANERGRAVGQGGMGNRGNRDGEDLANVDQELPPVMEFIFHGVGAKLPQTGDSGGLRSSDAPEGTAVADTAQVARFTKLELKANCSAQDAFGRLQAIAAKVANTKTKINEKKLKIKTEYMSTHGTVTFEARVFKSEDKGSKANFYVDFKRLDGDGFAFRTVARQYMDEMKDMAL